MRELLGVEAEELIAALQAPAATGVRANTAKIDPAQLAALLRWNLSPVPWCEPAFAAAEPPDRPGRHPLHDAGAFYLQDPSAMAVAEALDVRPGERVADLAAAPGGKATRLAEQAGPSGLLLANDPHPSRVVALGQNLERWGAANAVITQSSIDALADAGAGAFDGVLLDAPCSGEGMFRKSADARAMWSEGTVRACAARQGELLDQAARLVAPGGRLVYSTCTFAPEENEMAVAGFLTRNPGFAVEPIDLPGVGRGRPDWAGPVPLPSLSGAIRLWPHRHMGDGHFAVRMRRTGPGGHAGPTPAPAGPGAERVGSRRRRGAAPAPPADLVEFVERFLATEPYSGHALRTAGDKVYAVPLGAPRLGRTRVLRSGLWLGTLRAKRFEPSHALAMALRPDDALLRLDLDLDDPRLPAYLSGWEIDSAGADGWLLVCAAGVALGWGRRVRGSVRNHYPKGLRRP